MHGIRTRHFSTGALPSADRHEAFLNRDWPSLAPLYDTVPLEPFDIDCDTVFVDGLALLYTEITAQTWKRGAALVRTRESGMVAVNIALSGLMRGTMGERSFLQSPGTAIVSDHSAPSAHESTASRTITLLLPRATVAEAGLDLRTLHGEVLESPALSMLTSHLLHIRKALPTLDDADAPRLARSLVDLLVVAVHASGRNIDARAALASTAGERARAEIERNLGSHMLTAAALGRRLGISRATLHRLFAEEGGVRAYIRERRLEAAREALADPLNAERIGSIAERLGFSDTAHLSRLFRDRYGETPSDWRAAAPERGRR